RSRQRVWRRTGAGALLHGGPEGRRQVAQPAMIAARSRMAVQSRSNIGSTAARSVRRRYGDRWDMGIRVVLLAGVVAGLAGCGTTGSGQGPSSGAGSAAAGGGKVSSSVIAAMGGGLVSGSIGAGLSQNEKRNA